MGSLSYFRLYGVFLAIASCILFTINLLPGQNVDHDTMAQEQILRPNSTAMPSKTHVSPEPPSSSLRSPVAESPPAPGFELVLAHYSRNFNRIAYWTSLVREVPYIAKLGMKLTIYTKNPSVNLTQMRLVTGADEVHLLPNIGREGQTIIHHILRVHDNPAQFTMFTQDEPEWSLLEDGNLVEPFRRKLHDTFRPNTGFLGLNEWNEPCVCGDCGGRGVFPLQVQIFNTFLHDGTGEGCSGTNWNSWWSQFIVSRQRMQMHGPEKWQWLEKMISAPQEHWLHKEEEPVFIREQYMPEGSTPDNPLFGHTVERSWSMIFECSFEESVPVELGTLNQDEAHCLDWRMERDRREEMRRR